MLPEFIVSHRDEILVQARARVLARNMAPTDVELTQGLPAFLDQLCDALRRASSKETVNHDEIGRTARQHGNELFSQGLTVAQVVHDYGDLCQVITGLAGDEGANVAIDEFRTLNLCLDDAIAEAVTAHANRRERAIANQGTERLGFLAHELRNALGSAILAFASIKRGAVATGGSTSGVLDRSLMRLTALIDRSLSDVRLDAGLHHLERIPIGEILEEVEIAASLIAPTRGVNLVVFSSDPELAVEADRHILAAAVTNLLHNALKFTKPATTVRVRATGTASRVLIDIEDECGGLAPATPDELLEPFVQSGGDRTGLGLGLSIVLKAVKAMGAELHICDLPGKGCIFTIDLLRQAAPPRTL